MLHWGVRAPVLCTNLLPFHPLVNWWERWPKYKKQPVFIRISEPMRAMRTASKTMLTRVHHSSEIASSLPGPSYTWPLSDPKADQKHLCNRTLILQWQLEATWKTHLPPKKPSKSHLQESYSEFRKNRPVFQWMHYGCVKRHMEILLHF